MAKATTNLDLSRLPSLGSLQMRSIIATLAEPIAARLVSMPAVLGRARGAVMFAEAAPKASEEWQALAFLRAALADVVSMEDAQKIDRPSTSRMLIRTSAHPLVHLLALLRHQEIHVKSVSAASRRSIPATLGEHSFEMDAYVITNVSAAALVTLNNAQYYHADQIAEMAAWFDAAQMTWGAGHVIRVGVEAFAAEIAGHHGL